MNELEMECAERGAELLDNRWPGWWQEVDLSRLDLSNSCQCVLGQLGVDYNRAGRQMLGADYTSNAYAEQQDTGYSLFTNVIFPHLGMSEDDVQNYGFDEFWEDDDEFTTYDGLTEAWTREVNDRRQALGAMP